MYFRKLERLCGVSGAAAFYCPKPENPAYCSIKSILSFPSNIISVAGRECAAIASPPFCGAKKNAHTELYVNKWPFVYKIITCSLTGIVYLYLASEQNTLFWSGQLDCQSLNKQVTKKQL